MVLSSLLISSRDKELIKPTLQLFQNTKSQDHLVETFQKILDLKNRRKVTAIHSALLSVTSSLVSKKTFSKTDGKVEAYASEFWSELPEHIKGQQDDKKPGEYHSVEFGTLYKGTVSRMLQDNFGVESRHTRQGSLLTFDCATIIKLQSQLNTKIRVSGDAVTPVTTYREGGIGSHDANIENKTVDPPLQEPSHPSLPSQVAMQTGGMCGTELEPFYMRIHHCE
jgi:hypothetical protein